VKLDESGSVAQKIEKDCDEDARALQHILYNNTGTSHYSVDARSDSFATKKFLSTQFALIPSSAENLRDGDE